MQIKLLLLLCCYAAELLASDSGDEKRIKKAIKESKQLREEKWKAAAVKWKLKKSPLQWGIDVWKHVVVELVRQSQIVQSVMQDYQYDLSPLLPVCNLLVQGPKTTYNYCSSRRWGLLWCFTLNFAHFELIYTLN